jgi:group I intron endonuclease
MYIGSSVSLGKRFLEYYSLGYLERQIRKNKSMIYKSILKHGYSFFSLEILEYCHAEKCIEREQYYIDLLNPEYNILTKAGSSLGFKQSEETIAKIKNRI